MNVMKPALVTAAALALVSCATDQSPQMSGGKNMTFFVTSVGTGKGADLGGIAGADAHCQALAKAAGAGDRTWRAYLSTQGTTLNDPNVVHARDRIGAGPWHNVKGVRIASNVEDLHSAKNNVTKDTVLDEKGQPLNDRTMKPNMHDVLTGSRPDGTAFPGTYFDATCGNWTKSGADGSAYVGHHDRAGPTKDSWSTSWNSSHPSRGCSYDNLKSTGGDARFYCFAAN